MGEGRRLLHCTLEGDAEGHALDRAQLSDQQRVAVLLQAAALLAHLEQGRWYLPDSWDGVRLGDQAQLKVRTVVPGQAVDLPQVALRRLLRRLFRSDGEVAGRGEAKRAARHLDHRWLHTLAPIPAELAVVDILEAAPFLWQPAFAEARRALVGEHVDNGRSSLWLIAPGYVRRRLMRQADDRHGIEALLTGPDARSWWDSGDPEDDPETLMDEGRWRRALRAWRCRAPLTGRQAIGYARCLFTLGRYSQVLEALKGNGSSDARILRVWCQYQLGENGAALNALRRLEKSRLSASQLIELTTVAVRLAASRGRCEEGHEWVRRALAKSRGRGRLEALLIAAESAWDRDQLDEMDRHLGAAREALRDPDLAWRWHHVRGLRSMAEEDGGGVVEHLRQALRVRRRRLPQADAARLWNDLALGHAWLDDLPAAERACRHALRLFSRCEGPRFITLALYNLAEVRLRRGRFDGVEDILEKIMAENRRSGNIRGLIRDLELWIRLELSQGRLLAALARDAEVRQQYQDHLGPRSAVFAVLAARAYGWLGRRNEARNRLLQPLSESLAEDASRTLIDKALRDLEPEERPALWAHAGLWSQAVEAAAGSVWERLWTSLAAESFPPPELWQALDLLEPFRAARLIFDCEQLHPGMVPPHRVRRAIDTLNRAGAGALAEKLENRSSSPWHALDRYLERPSVQPRDAEELLRRAGYREVDLQWITPTRRHVLAPGRGGPREICAPLERGRLVLRAPFIDQTLKTLFSLIQRDLELPRPGREPPRGVPSKDGIIGESRALTRALERLDQLAQGDLPILLLGESGSGKELFARRAHQQSRRQGNPFLVINCAALSESLILSDLFGHVRGAFTGADSDRRGVFESARSGTLFLDEIGDLPASAQGKLLRVLQEGEIRRLGESFPRKVDVRVVAATHRDLEQMVRDDQFRQDLFFRLKVATVKLPPLRDRDGDLFHLAAHFLRQRAATDENAATRLSDAARKLLQAYSWPGNVRELRNVLEVAATLATQDVIEPEHLDLPAPATRSKGQYHRKVKDYRRKLLADALRHSAGNRSAAARNLGLTRQALSYLIRELDIEV